MEAILPRNGVYAVIVYLKNQKHFGMLNLGVNLHLKQLHLVLRFIFLTLKVKCIMKKLKLILLIELEMKKV